MVVESKAQIKTPAVLSVRTVAQGAMAASAFTVLVYFTHWSPPEQVLLASQALFTGVFTYIQNWIEKRANG